MARPSNRDRIDGRRNPIGDGGRAAERRLADEMDGTLRPASGALAGAKGDIQWGRFLIEVKATERGSFSLKFEWLAKIAREAYAEGQIPALSVRFIKGAAGHVRTFGDWVMIPRRIFEEMVDAFELDDDSGEDSPES